MFLAGCAEQEVNNPPEPAVVATAPSRGGMPDWASYMVAGEMVCTNNYGSCNISHLPDGSLVGHVPLNTISGQWKVVDPAPIHINITWSRSGTDNEDRPANLSADGRSVKIGKTTWMRQPRLQPHTAVPFRGAVVYLLIVPFLVSNLRLPAVIAAASRVNSASPPLKAMPCNMVGSEGLPYAKFETSTKLPSGSRK